MGICSGEIEAKNGLILDRLMDFVQDLHGEMIQRKRLVCRLNDLNFGFDHYASVQAVFSYYHAMLKQTKFQSSLVVI